MASAFVPDFKPSTCGFRFSNCFPKGPILRIPIPGFGTLRIGDASKGLCGGMVFAAVDFFSNDQGPPPDADPPPGQSFLFRYLVKRLFSSFHLPRGPLKYYHWMNLPDHATGRRRGVYWRTVAQEWPRVRAELDRGRLAPVGMVKVRSKNPFEMGNNHQVLAYGYELDEATSDLKVHLYDPNFPGEDGVHLSLSVADPDRPGPIDFSMGGTIRGFFHTPYRACRLPAPTLFGCAARAGAEAVLA